MFQDNFLLRTTVSRVPFSHDPQWISPNANQLTAYFSNEQSEINWRIQQTVTQLLCTIYSLHGSYWLAIHGTCLHNPATSSPQSSECQLQPSPFTWECTQLVLLKYKYPYSRLCGIKTHSTITIPNMKISVTYIFLGFVLECWTIASATSEKQFKHIIVFYTRTQR